MTQPQSQPPPGFEPEQEIRLALVLYGGVSLAIYINGVTQELFELVRATAPDASGGALLLPDTELTPAGRVYRTLGRMLGNETLSTAAAATAPVRTRFVIDVLSGTSAGGINGVVLAKALVNQQAIGKLQTLWVDEGDIGGLVNDKQSLHDSDNTLRASGVALRAQPASLLNSQRLYVKVLKALDDMDADDPAAAASPYVDELDLYVTTTDLDGLVLPLRLADRVVNERRFRNVFNFVYAKAEACGEERNDFGKENNPFLAFAARCTSSFPFAFEPMVLDDISSLSPFRGGAADYRSKRDDWKIFYRDYGDQFAARSFGDGGYVDNKPFSYATESLLRRRANLRTVRKLVYVEPSPDRLEPGAAARPDAVANALKALVTIPGSETIREDLQRVRDRNRLIDRLRAVTGAVEADVALRPPQAQAGDRYAQNDLRQMIAEKGIAYGGYHRLKVSALTDELAELIVRRACLREASDEFVAVRYLVQAWRERTYAEVYPVDAQGAVDRSRPSQNRMLMDLDHSYRLRRLTFVRSKIEELIALDAEGLQRFLRLIDSSGALAQQLGSAAALDDVRARLRVLKRAVGEVHVKLRCIGRNMRAAIASDADRSAFVSSLCLEDRHTLRRLLQGSTDVQRREMAKWLLSDDVMAAGFTALAVELSGTLRPLCEAAAEYCRMLLAPPGSDAADALARACARHYYTHYDDYDLIVFPITYGTGAGEAAPVDIVRISPVDACSLNDEAHGPGKLAGNTLFHFGGFLDDVWRLNDMLWGRLDGAERIIVSLLPDRPDDAARLVADAHEAILTAEQARDGLPDAYRNIVAALLKRLAALRSGSRNPPACPNILKEQPLDRERMVRVTARATTVVGGMLRQITASRGIAGDPAAVWLARLGGLLWGLVEVSVPRSLWHFGFRYWVKLLVLFGVLLVVSGVISGSTPIRDFGVMVLGTTIGILIAVAALGDVLRRRVRAVLIVLAALVVFAPLGVIQAYSWLGPQLSTVAALAHAAVRRLLGG